MAQELNISTQLNDLLVTRNYSPEMLDRQGKPSGAEDAKTFTFDYVSGSGKNYGTMVVILDSDNDMKVFYGDNLGRAMEGDDKDQFFDFQQQLNKFARMHRWTYTAKDLSQLKHTMQGLAAIQEGLFEGYYGTRKISYAGEPTEARLMIKHNRTLGEADARFRYVESLFIETADSQRFKLPFKNLGGGRAMLEHVRQGGNPYDVRGVHIAEMVQEIGTLSRFNRASATRVMEGATQELITEARAYYKSLRENMKRLASPRGYQAYFETWHPATIDEQQDLVEDIKTLFIEQTLDTRIEAALPLLARIQQQGNAMKEAQIFENWVNGICEGTWSLPETPEQEEKLREILSQELIVGADATNATEQLYDLIGDDQLFDTLGEIAQDDPNTDVRQVVIDRLAELGYDLGIEVADAAADAGAEMPAAEEPAPEVQEDIHALEESLRSMLKSAGMAVSEGRILDEAGETFDHILARFKHEVKRFEEGDELDSDLYEALFDYYSDHGEIPYGIAKGRDGDPFEWVTQRLDQDLGLNEDALDDHTAEKTQNMAMGIGGIGLGLGILEGSCNHTMEGEYCPEHGLMECGGMMEMGTVAGGMAPVMGEQGIDEDMSRRGFLRGLGAAAVAGAGGSAVAGGYTPGKPNDWKYNMGVKRPGADEPAANSAPVQSPTQTTGASSSPSAASKAAAERAMTAAAKLRYTNPKFRQEYEEIEKEYQQTKSVVYDNKIPYSKNPDLAKRQHAESMKILIAADKKFADQTNALINQYGRLKEQDVAEGQLDEGAIETITALVKKIPGIGKYYQMAQQYKPQLIEILKTSKSGKEVKQKMEQLVAQQSAPVAESGMLKQLGGLAVGGGSILSTMWMNAMGLIDGVLAKAAAGEVGGAIASGSILGLIPVTLMLFAAMLMFKGSNQSSDEKAQAFQAQRSGMQEANDDPINYNAAITGSYYESREDPLARIKSLALRK